MKFSQRASVAAAVVMSVSFPVLSSPGVVWAGTSTGGTVTQSQSAPSIQVTSSSVKAGYSTATVQVSGQGTTFAQGSTQVTLSNDVNGSVNLTAATTVNSDTSLSIALPTGNAGIGAGTYTLTVITGGQTASTTLTIAPYTNAATVQWDGIYTSDGAMYVSNPNPAPGSDVTIALRAYSGNLTKVVLNCYDTAQSKGFQIDMKPGKTFGPYQLWTATVPASNGGTIYYRYDISDGNSFACLSGDGLHTSDTASDNFPLPVGNFLLSSTQVQPGESITANDNTGDFSGGQTVVNFVDDKGNVVATTNGRNANWSAVDFTVPQNLADGLYRVQVITEAKDADGVVNVQFKRQSEVVVGQPPAWMTAFEHNSYQSFYRSPFGAVATNTPITLRLRAPKDLKSASLRLWNAAGKTGETDLPMQPSSLTDAEIAQQTGVKSANSYSWWTVTIPASDVTTPGTMWYQFKATLESGEKVYYDDNGSQLEGPGELSFRANGPSYQISVYQAGFQTPNWLKHAVIYEIMPDRFYNGNIANDENPKTQKGIYLSNSGETLGPIQFHQDWNSLPYDPNVKADTSNPQIRSLRGNGQWNIDFFGGDLQGIEDKLDYLKTLGVNTLYLMPVFQSESNHKYDTADYMKIDPGFGTAQDWLNLVKAAKAKGMHIILDGVFETTGSDSKYFNEFGNFPSNGAWQAYQNAAVHSPYYNWYQWTGNPQSPYNGWGGNATMPLTNTNSPSYQQFIYGGADSVAKHWLNNGASGWRLDSADNGNYNTQWWGAFRQAVKQIDPEAAMIGEIWGNATNDNGTDWLTGKTFDSVMNYQFRNAIIDFFRGNYNDSAGTHRAADAATFNQELMRLYSEYPKQSFYAMMNLLDSQDTMRILTVLENAPSPGSMTAAAQATYQPSAADKQLGIERLKLVTDLQFAFPGAPTIWYGDEAGQTGYSDPLNRKTYPWGNQNEAVLNHYRQLGAIRSANPVLQTGQFTPLYTQGQVYAFARTISGGKDVFGNAAANASAVVALNNQNQSATVNIPVKGNIANGTKLLDELNHQWYTVQNGEISMQLEPYQGAILVTPTAAPVAYLQQDNGQTSVAWTPVAGATGYQVWTQDDNGHLHAVGHKMSANADSVDVTSLKGTHATKVWVEALFGKGQGHPGGVPKPGEQPGAKADVNAHLSNAVTVPAASLQMGQVQATATANAMQLQWQPVADASTYHVYEQTADGGYQLVKTVNASPAHPGQGHGHGKNGANTKPVQVQLDLPSSGGGSTTIRVEAENADGVSLSSAVTVTFNATAQGK